MITEATAQDPPLIAVVGPTAVGKTTVAIDLASIFGGEIVCADSRTQYRGLDIGAAKPTPEQRARIPHHLLDVIAPDETFSLAQFQQAAYRAIAEITARGRVPFLVGGAGLYVKAVLEGYAIPEMQPNPDLRAALLSEAERIGAQQMHERLRAVDPEAARRILQGNVRRVVRALEVYETLGVPISSLQTKTPPPYRTLVMGLTRSPQSLRQRIAARVDDMLAAGLVEEVRSLLQRGYERTLPAMSGIGYREVAAYLSGEIDLATARMLILRNTQRFVRRQYQWFRLSDPAMRWFNLDHAGATLALEQHLLDFGLPRKAS